MADLNEIRNRMKKRKEIRSSFSSSRFHSDTLKQDADTVKVAESHYHLGKCYDYGVEGYPEDEEKEYQEYQIAADLGHTAAMVEVAVDYADEDDSVLGYDPDKAEMWARRAIEGGNPDGYKVLYDIFMAKNKHSDAIAYFEIGISKGSLDCIEEKGWNLYWGYDEYGEDIDPQPEAALNLLKDKEWNRDHPLALEVLGKIYEERADYSQAIKFYEEALVWRPDDVEIKSYLGRVFRTADNYLDYDRAKELLKSAAEEGFALAMNHYALMLYQGEGMAVNKDLAIEWFKKAAGGGEAYAMFNLGTILEDENPEEAEHWYILADEAGVPDAKEALENLKARSLEKTLSPVSQQQAEPTPQAPPIYRRRGDGYFITDRCISCGTCQPVCPVEAIHEGEIYWIDPDICISCGSCASVCPNDAIDD